MKKVILFSLLFICCTYLKAQCPVITAILVDACQTEQNNEFLVLKNGSTALPVDNIDIDLPNHNDITSAETTDFDSYFGSNNPTGTGCNFIVLDDGQVIPANATVILFTSLNLSFTFNFTQACTEAGGNIYLLFKNDTPGTGTFSNTDAFTRTTSLSIQTTYSGCNADFTYTNAGPTTNGDYYLFPTPSGSVSFTNIKTAASGCDFSNKTLPISLLSFTGKSTNQHILLHWQTATEKDNAYMAVERSKDGIHFFEIGRVQGHGTTLQPQTYYFTDGIPLTGTNYYRLKQIDLNDAFEYHRIIAVEFADKAPKNSFQIYPTEVNQVLTIVLNEPSKSETQIIISDIMGRILQEETILSNLQKLNINVTLLPPGHYFITVQSDRIFETARFVKGR